MSPLLAWPAWQPWFDHPRFDTLFLTLEHQRLIAWMARNETMTVVGFRDGSYATGTTDHWWLARDYPVRTGAHNRPPAGRLVFQESSYSDVFALLHSHPSMPRPYSTTDEVCPRSWWEAYLRENGELVPRNRAYLRGMVLKNVLASLDGRDLATAYINNPHILRRAEAGAGGDGERQQHAAYWLAVYAFLMAPRRTRLTHLTFNAQTLARREQWIELRGSGDDRPQARFTSINDQVVDNDDADDREIDEDDPLLPVPLETNQQALWWLLVLRDYPDRFQTGRSSPLEDHSALSCDHCWQCCLNEMRAVYVLDRDDDDVDDDDDYGNRTEHIERWCVDCVDAGACIAFPGRALDERHAVLYRTADTVPGFTSNGAFARLSCQYLRELFERCEACGSTIASDLSLCPHCRRSVVRTWMESSHTALAPSRCLTADGEGRATTLLYLGVELEVEFPTLTHDTVGELMRAIQDRNYMIFKPDGSLLQGHGVEIVTAPISFRRWQADHSQWKDWLARMRNLGLRSYDSGRCGMHVHLSRAGLSPKAICIIQAVVFNNPVLFSMIGQRAGNRYSNFQPAAASSQAARISRAAQGFGLAARRSILGHRLAPAAGDRYSAVGVPANHPTVELRFFRGTLNHVSFFKNIECAHALAEYANQASLRETSGKLFLQFVYNNPLRYRHLIAFLQRQNNGAGVVPSFSRPQVAKALAEVPAFTASDAPETPTGIGASSVQYNISQQLATLLHDSLTGPNQG